MPPNRINLISMKANIIFHGLLIEGVEVTLIGQALFQFNLNKEGNLTIINFLTEHGATMCFSSRLAMVTVDRRDVSYTLIG